MISATADLLKFKVACYYIYMCVCVSWWYWMFALVDLLMTPELFVQTRKRVLINAFTVRALRDTFPPARGAGIRMR